MPSTFRILFRGFCAFVPKYEEGEPSSVSLLLPFAMRPREERKGRNFLVPPHAAALIYDPDDIYRDTTNLTPDVAFKKRRGRRNRAAFGLLGNAVTIHRTDDHETQLELPRDVPTDPLNPTGAESQSLYYLLHLRELLGSSSKRCVKRKFLRTDKSARSILSAHLKITQGKLYVNRLDQDDDFIRWRWHRRSRENPEQIRLAAIQIGLELDEVTAPVELHLRRFENEADDDRPDRFVFRGDRDVTVQIVHSEAEKIFGLPFAASHKVDNRYIFDLDMRGYIHLARGVSVLTGWRDLWCDLENFGGRHGVCKSIMLDHPDSTFGEARLSRAVKTLLERNE